MDPPLSALAFASARSVVALFSINQSNFDAWPHFSLTVPPPRPREITRHPLNVFMHRLLPFSSSLNTPEFSHKRDGFSGKPSAMTPRLAAAAAVAGAAGAAAASSYGGGSGGGVAGFPRSGDSVAGRGLDMVAAAAAQVVSRDSEDSGSGGGGLGDDSVLVRGPVGTGKAPAPTAALHDTHAVSVGSVHA